MKTPRSTQQETLTRDCLFTTLTCDASAFRIGAVTQHTTPDGGKLRRHSPQPSKVCVLVVSTVTSCCCVSLQLFDAALKHNVPTIPVDFLHLLLPHISTRRYSTSGLLLLMLYFLFPSRRKLRHVWTFFSLWLVCSAHLENHFCCTL